MRSRTCTIPAMILQFCWQSLALARMEIQLQRRCRLGVMRQVEPQRLVRSLALKAVWIPTTCVYSFTDFLYHEAKVEFQKFEGDASLTRADFFFGDDHTFNDTYFAQLTALAYNGGLKTDVINSYSYNQTVLAQHQFNRYQNSLATNPNFFFGPKAILLYGAASFLYELFPSHGPAGAPAFIDIGAFYGTTNPDAEGVVTFNNTEHVPTGGPGWFSRTDPYNISALVVQVLDLYTAHPVLFGGNVGVGNFDALSFGAITDGQLSLNAQDVLCLFYQLATDEVPDSLSSVLELPSELLSFATSKLNPIFENSGCTLATPL